MKTWLLVLTLSSQVACLALDPTVTKLLSGRSDGNTLDDSFGISMDGSDRWVVIGESGNGEKGLEAGAAYVFDAATGARKRKLLAPDGAAGHDFGRSVSVSGNRVLVGAPGRGGDVGGAYLFDAVTGKLLAQLFHDLASTNDRFGSAVALEGDVAVVGAMGDDSNQGSAFVFDLKGKSGVVVSEPADKLVAVPRSINSAFGWSVVTDGRFVFVGAPTEASNNGAIYGYDVVGRSFIRRHAGTGAERLGFSLAMMDRKVVAGAPGFSSSAGRIRTFEMVTGGEFTAVQAPAPVAGGEFGVAMAVADSMLIVGEGEEIVGGEGKVNVFNIDREHLHVIEAPDGVDGAKFGSTVAIAGNSVVVFADPGGNAIAYRFTPLAVDLANNAFVLAKIKDSAPGTGSGVFKTFDSITLGEDSDEEVLLRGTSSNGVKGIWDFEEDPLTPSLLSTDNVSPLPAGTEFPKSFSTPMWNSPLRALIPGKLKSSSPRDDTLFFYQVETNPTPDVFGILLRLGTTFNTGGVAGDRTLSAFNQIVQSEDATLGSFAIAPRFKVGANGVTAAKDTGIMMFDSVGNLEGAVVEGAASPAGGLYGEISPRVALTGRRVLYHARLTGVAAPQALFLFSPSPSALNFSLAQGGVPMSIGAGVISSILGETISGDDQPVARMILSGLGISTQNNEILAKFPAAVVRAMEEGQGATDLGEDVVISRFVRFWSISGGQFAAQVVVRGPGVEPKQRSSLHSSHGKHRGTALSAA
jgi:hypothetical protein